MATGFVRLFHPAKRYGFIQQESGGEDVFVHASVLRMAGLKRLRKGQKVHFEIYDNQGRPAARNLRVQEDALEEQDRFQSQEEQTPKDVSPGSSPADSNRSAVSRKRISRADLEQVLAEAVRTSHSECKPFVGVIIEKIISNSRSEAGWAVKGVRYGNADRTKCSVALSNCLNELQREYQLMD
ncbi:cold-shock protein [Bradyrhizobium archetypum]|uniref:Cold shock domain-containing protein n=1 Tax=Bradyrhizobium archetypum TaxID=2721160 RepID=A0A7Y4H5I2_9BRAD|nr:cold shock domain-containing protein [Bradyrhizobium archetypum]